MYILCVCVRVLVAQSCPTLCYPMDCSWSGSSVHGILQARILEWVAIPFSSMCVYIYILFCTFSFSLIKVSWMSLRVYL